MTEARRAGSELNVIVDEVRKVSDMTAQVATATERAALRDRRYPAQRDDHPRGL